MQFGILGPLDIRSPDGTEISVGGPRPRALLVMLLVEAGRAVGTAQLIDGQYGDRPPPGAANAVQAQISRLRRRLPAEVIDTVGSAGRGHGPGLGLGYRLSVDLETIDAHRFERLAATGHRLLASGRPEAAAAALRDSLALWRGPALADLPPGPFAEAQAARLEELRLTAHEDLAAAELALPTGTSSAELRRLLSEHPLRERLAGLLIRALAGSGRQAEALAVYDEIRRRLAEELGADPSPELAEIHLAVLRAEQPAAAPRRRASEQLSSFVGRTAELRRLDRLRTARLLTLTGPGGTGKTRLAVEATGRRTDLEVCFVDLSLLGGGDGDQVPSAVLGALGLRDPGFHAQGPTSPADRLAAALAEQRLLLVLDNCEQVVTPVAVLARRLLGDCPELHILATSREALGITGEVLVPLAPLDGPPALPRPDAGSSMPQPPRLPHPSHPSHPPQLPPLTPSAALEYPAVRLFADRAAAVRPGFTVCAENVAEVARICAALDGLPLALELAAARLRAFDIGELTRRLAEHGRFRLLSRGDRSAAARHRTLRGVVEWSWDLLGPEERALARRFAVFVGGARLEAIEAVCAEPGEPGEPGRPAEPGEAPADSATADTAELLADLVDKSLITRDGERYRMLNTVQLFCAEQLDESGEAQALHGAHLRWFLDLAQRVDPHLRSAEQLHWLAHLDAEHGNLMAALRHAVAEDHSTALHLIAALGTYGWLGGRRSRLGEAASTLLARCPEPPDGFGEEYVMCVMHAVPRARPELWQRAARVMDTRATPLRYPCTAALWGGLVGPRNPPDAEHPTDFGETRLLAPDPWNQALLRLSLGVLGILSGEPAAAEAELTQVLAAFRELGERWGTAQCLDWLAVPASWRGDWSRAHDLRREALELLDELGALEESAEVLVRRAEVLLRLGETAAASADLLRAEELIRRAGWPSPPAAVPLGLGEVARLTGDHTAARAHYLAALRASATGGVEDIENIGDIGDIEDIGDSTTHTRTRTALGRLATAEGEPEESLRQHRLAVVSARRSVVAVDLAEAAEGLAGALLPGSGERSALLLGTAVALRGTAVAGDGELAATAATARELIGSAAFAAAFSNGAGLAREDALTAVDTELERLSAPGK